MLQINIFLLCYNESVLLPHTVKHYKKYLPSCTITIYDNMSTDNSVEIAKLLGCNVISWDSDNIINDYKYRYIKNNCWKNIDKGWIIMADMDEWLCITEDLLIKEQEQGTTILSIKGIDMIGESQTLDLNDICLNDIKKYVDNNDENKQLCFNKDYISEMNYILGAHWSEPIGIVKYSTKFYYNKHMCNLGLPFIINKMEKRYERSTLMRKDGLALHYINDREKITCDYNNKLYKSKIFTSDMLITYGIDDNNIDVTTICKDKLLYDNYIIIPPNDNKRSIYFSDPVISIRKFIFIKDKNNTMTKYDDTQTIYIDISSNNIYLEENVPYEVRLLNIKKINQMVLAYYFPQYYGFYENNIVHGNNFTDWDLFKRKDNPNLSICKFPLKEPLGLDYYDPRLIDIRIKQKSLAKKYSVDGFIYYHYWLENKPVMDTVLNNLMNDNEPDIPFCLCFANESWKHNYNSVEGQYKSFHPDGTTFRQLYDNPIEHANYLQKIFLHKNYIKIDNKPILFIYRSNIHVYSYIDSICNELKKYNINDIYLIANTSNYCLNEYNKNIIRKPNAYSPFKAHTCSSIPSELSILPCIYGGLMGWNKSPRHIYSDRIDDFDPITITLQTYKDLLTMYYDNSSPQIYALFAWNEWAEGAVIEPNTVYGEELGYAIKKARRIINNIINMNIELYYGIDNNYKNVTYISLINFTKYIKDKWYLYIPHNSSIRNNIFGDHIIGVHKNIKVIINNLIIVCNEHSNIEILIE